MTNSTPRISDAAWRELQRHFGYTEEELALFRADPRNELVVLTGRDMRAKTIVFQVVESSGCNSQHLPGTRFFFSGDGNLLTRMGPSRVCAYLLPVMAQAIFGLQELWYAGVDPNRLCFKRAACFDVGVRCGGWGRCVVEARVLGREEAQALAAVG